MLEEADLFMQDSSSSFMIAVSKEMINLIQGGVYMTNRKMIRKLTAFALVLLLGLLAHSATAEHAQQGTQSDETAQENAVSAMKVSLPEATLHYAVREYDDGRAQWNLFFTQGASIGICKVNEENNTIRKVELYEMTDGMLTADKAMQMLEAEKGPLTVVELELDRERDSLVYEGEAEVDGKRYEFEMNALGRIIEWERD